MVRTNSSKHPVHEYGPRRREMMYGGHNNLTLMAGDAGPDSGT